MSRSRSRLPVDPEFVDKGYFVRGLPERIPDRYIPNIQIPGAIERDLPLIAGVVLQELQADYGRHELRTFLYNMMAENEFDNKDYDQLVGSVAEAFFFFFEGERMEAPDALRKATQVVLRFTMALYVEKYPELDEYVDGKMDRELRDAMDDGRDLIADIEDFNRGSRRGRGRDDRDDRGRGRGDDRDDRRGGRSRGREDGGYRGNGSRGYGGSRRRDEEDDTDATATRRGGMAGVVRASSKDNRDDRPSRDERSSRRDTPREDRSREFSSGGVEERGGNDLHAVEEELHASPRGHNYQNHEAQRKADATPSRPMPKLFDRSKGTVVSADTVDKDATLRANIRAGRPYDRVDLEDGSFVIPEVLSTYKKTFSPEQPFALVYDPNLFVKFHRVYPDGRVDEVVKERNADMDYLDLETDENRKSKAQHQRRQGRVDPRFDLVANMHKKGEKMVGVELAAPSGEVTEGSEESTFDNLVFGPDTEIGEVATTVPAMSVAQAIAMTEVVAVEDEGEDTPKEFYIDILTPHLVEANLIGTFLAIGKEKTVQAALAKFSQLQGQEDVPVRLWHQLNDALTARINYVLKNSMGLSWTIDTAADDFGDLLKAMQAKASVGVAAANLLNSKVDEVFNSVMRVLKDEELARFAEEYGKAGAGMHWLVFARRQSVTLLSWSSADMGPSLVNGGVVSEQLYPALHASLDRLLQRTAIVGGEFCHRYLVTEDNVAFDLQVGFFNNSHYVLTPSKVDIMG